MKRTQLYLDDDLWQAMHDRAAREKTTLSDLARTAMRDRYLVDPVKRREALMGIVGLWKDRTDLPDTETYIRNLRDDDRLERLKSE